MTTVGSFPLAIGAFPAFVAFCVYAYHIFHVKSTPICHLVAAEQERASAPD